MAEIYLARMAGTDGFSKLVVVKRLLAQMASDPEFIQMFLDEARINARLSHSNIVQVLELGEFEKQYFIAMEYVPGLSVAQVGKLATQRLGEVPQGVACGIITQACAGLHHAHETKLPDGAEMGIIHRDVSPQNLLLTYEGFVKVVDFGIAKAEGRATQTRAGMVKGKFAYMSPEQCAGEPLDRRTDIFALGIILFELCTSRRLFRRANTFETYEAIIKCEVPDPRAVNPNVSEKIAQVITKALAKKREDRFPTAEAMQEALELAMRRSSVRGSAMDLSRFIDSNFADQVREQEDLIRRIEAGELTQPELPPAAEAGSLAESYTDVGDDELQEDEDGPTHNDEAGQRKVAPPPPMPAPAVRSVRNENAPLPNLPVSMALPVINAKQAIADMLSGAAPNVLGDKLQAIAQAAKITAADRTGGRPPSGQAAAPSRPSGQGAAPSGSSGQAWRSGQGPAPVVDSAISSADRMTPREPQRAPKMQSFLERVANLPLLLLLAIGIGLALLAAGLTAVLIW